HLIIYTLFFFTHPATTKIYTLSLHDALPISGRAQAWKIYLLVACDLKRSRGFKSLSRRSNLIFSGIISTQIVCQHGGAKCFQVRSEEHTSELQSHLNLVCRLLLEKKKTII